MPTTLHHDASMFIPPLLLPTPRDVQWTSTSHPWVKPDVRYDPTFPPEGYRITLDDTGILITTRDAVGERWALATLAQLRQQDDQRYPGGLIDDRPVFATRGVMVDISRDRIPTMEEFGRIVAQLASWKINHLQVYVEHTVAYRGHEEVWADTSAMTLDELEQLEGICQAQGITLAANQNCFGHLSAWFRQPRYAGLAEIAPDGWWDFNGLVRRQGGFSLCPADPGSIALIKDLLGQLLPRLRAPWVNIGCDETFDLGQGRSREAVAAQGRAAVYSAFVRQICAVAQQYGKRPQFWADIALEHPEALAALPIDLLALAWGYEGDSPFARWFDHLDGREGWVCPGTSSWRSFTGRTTERQANLLAAAAETRATGFLVTDWGDLGHRQQWPITRHALAEAAHRAWSGTRPYDPRAGGLFAAGDPHQALWLDALGDVDLPLRQTCGRTPGAPLRNATALFTDWHKPLSDLWLGSVDQWQSVDDALTAMTEPSDGECAIALRQARLAARRAVARRRGDTHTLRALAPQVLDLVEEHRRAWLSRCRPGGLSASCAHDRTVAEELTRA